jgi:hypothetical protein
MLERLIFWLEPAHSPHTPANVHFWTADVVWGSKITPLTLKGGVIQNLRSQGVAKKLRWYILQVHLNFHTSVDAKIVFAGLATQRSRAPHASKLSGRP